MKTKAQSIIEYAIIIAVVAAAFVAMQTYLQRSVQSALRPLDEQLSPRSQKYAIR